MLAGIAPLPTGKETSSELNCDTSLSCLSSASRDEETAKNSWRRLKPPHLVKVGARERERGCDRRSNRHFAQRANVQKQSSRFESQCLVFILKKNSFLKTLELSGAA